MIHISPEELIEFVRARNEVQLPTQKQRQLFTVRVAGDGLEYVPSRTGTPRPHELKWLSRVCERFSQTNSFRPGDYIDLTVNASYTLALIRAYCGSGTQESNVNTSGIALPDFAMNDAQNRIENLLPNADERRAILDFLKKSIETANVAAPKRWGLSWDRGIVLNVGRRSNVLTIHKGRLVVKVNSARKPVELRGVEGLQWNKSARPFYSISIKSERETQGDYDCIMPTGVAYKVLPYIRRQHDLWIKEVSRNSIGRPERSAELLADVGRHFTQSLTQPGDHNIDSIRAPKSAESTELTTIQLRLENEGDFLVDNAFQGKEKVLRSIALRRGQREFREKLLNAYNGKCAVTGMEVLAVLEAAHIIPYDGEDTNHIKNGLLLRADIHTLFDLGLIKINPEDFSISCSDTISSDPTYKELHGRRIRLPLAKQHWPDVVALRKHFAL